MQLQSAKAREEEVNEVVRYNEIRESCRDLDRCFKTRPKVDTGACRHGKGQCKEVEIKTIRKRSRRLLVGQLSYDSIVRCFSEVQLGGSG